MSFILEDVAHRALEWEDYMGQYRKMVGGGTAMIMKSTM
jgi:hypothetical protein